MKVATNVMKQMLGYVNKCKPSNMLEISSYYELMFNEKGLTVKATDGVNIVSVTVTDGHEYEPQSIIVKADIFSKLVSKTTAEHLILEVKEDNLEVKGNGTYRVELFTEEDYVRPDITVAESFKVRTEQLKQGLVAGKNAKSPTSSTGVLYSYLLSKDKMIATDSMKISCAEVKGFDESILIPPGLANLLEMIDTDTVEIGLSEDRMSMLVKGGGIEIFGALAEGADEYPDVLPLFEVESKYNAKINVADSIKALERLYLFVSTFDNHLVYATFTDTALLLTTSNGSAEVINYMEVSREVGEEVEYTVNTQYLLDVLKGMKAETVTIEFDDSDMLIFRGNKNQFILAVAGDEE